MPLTEAQVARVAGLELNALANTGVLADELEGGRITGAGTPVYDLNGTLLFYRVPLSRGRKVVGYSDVGAHEALGEPLLGVSTGIAWNEKAIVKEATAAARAARPDLRFDEVRFVAYSFPKIGLLFLLGGREVLLLEWRTWAVVPPTTPQRKPLEPGNFERWSLLDESPAKVREARSATFKARIEAWKAPVVRRIDATLITRVAFDLPKILRKLVDTREIHYSTRPADHHPCYELRGQQTSVWCVAASVEMLLNFYRYSYDQPRLATELGLGTCEVPNGLPYGQEDKVVTTIEKLSSNTLDATKIATPDWSVYRDEIRANRPMISFIPGHSRTVVGYTQNLFTLPTEVAFKGLLIYDPWPPTDCAHPEDGGVITQWENWNTQTYRYGFTAALKHV